MIAMTLCAHDLRRVCVEAPCDPRTLRKYLSGGDVRRPEAEKIGRALVRLGFGSLRRLDTPHSPSAS
jgi:hypothetical protein